jgi:calmodulin
MCFPSQVAVLAGALASREALEEYADAFQLFDRDGDGLLDAGELRPAICLLGHEPTPEEVQGWLREFDGSKKGALSLPEFAAMMVAKTCLAEDPIALREAFRVFDRGCTGTISKDDFVSRMRLIGESVTDEELTELIETLGGHGDQITFCEFQKFAKTFASEDAGVGGDDCTFFEICCEDVCGDEIIFVEAAVGGA